MKSLRKIQDDPEPDEPQGPARPGAKLAAEVVRLALLDCGSTDEREQSDARRFFFDESASTFTHWAALLDLDVLAVQERVAAILATGANWSDRRSPAHAGLRRRPDRMSRPNRAAAM